MPTFFYKLQKHEKYGDLHKNREFELRKCYSSEVWQRDDSVEVTIQDRQAQFYAEFIDDSKFYIFITLTLKFSSLLINQ